MLRKSGPGRKFLANPRYFPYRRRPIAGTGPGTRPEIEATRARGPPLRNPDMQGRHGLRCWHEHGCSTNITGELPHAGSGCAQQMQGSTGEANLDRRRFLLYSAGAVVASATSLRTAWAKVPKPYRWDEAPPLNDREAFIKWMVENRGEDPVYLGQRFDRYQVLVRNKDLWNDRNKRAFLLTPREEFVLKRNLERAYDHAFLDIGYGVTISGPHVVGRMTSSIDVKFGEKVLEIGTGSGYQSAYLATLTDKVWTIEIIKPLAERTRAIYDSLIEQGYTEYKAISSKNADGYYGWEEKGPFDKIIVTCGIDHIPPPLLQQLKVGGIMVIPVGPPGAQRILKVVKEKMPDGSINVARSDIYGGKIVPFVPFTKIEGGVIKGTHDQ
jgi:protein-L-isoaspartate(D-aspartate) O-methyltransferase